MRKLRLLSAALLTAFAVVAAPAMTAEAGVLTSCPTGGNMGYMIQSDNFGNCFSGNGYSNFGFDGRNCLDGDCFGNGSCTGGNCVDGNSCSGGNCADGNSCIGGNGCQGSNQQNGLQTIPSFRGMGRSIGSSCR